MVGWDRMSRALGELERIRVLPITLSAGPWRASLAGSCAAHPQRWLVSACQRYQCPWSATRDRVPAGETGAPTVTPCVRPVAHLPLGHVAEDPATLEPVSAPRRCIAARTA